MSFLKRYVMMSGISWLDTATASMGDVVVVELESGIVSVGRGNAASDVLSWSLCAVCWGIAVCMCIASTGI